MAEILVLWMLGLIVIAIAWGGIDTIAVPLKMLAQALHTPERSTCLQIVVASLMALAVISIMVTAANNNIEEGVGLPALFIWAGGIWLIPFRFDIVEHYWLSSLAIAVILVPLWVGKTSSHASTQADAQTDVSTQQGQDRSPSATGLGFLFWIFLFGLTVAAIARYTSGWNAAALNS
ncbi:MAG: hypothetical protein OJF51_000556 [Nitrospira sp.]|jgi:hypothetical protein|nr:MAG: hypothetical protein OJF51_000556 [Nitrospira sp.]